MVGITLTTREAEALRVFIETGLSITGMVLKGDPDYLPMTRVDDKLRRALARAKGGGNE